MELWIRSQDRKRLTKVEDIYMVEDENNFTSYIGNNIVGHLGEYKKVGRALEVLDEIQSKLTSNKIIMQLDRNTHIRQEDVDIFYNKYDIKFLPAGANLKSIPNDIVIYEMPKE